MAGLCLLGAMVPLRIGATARHRKVSLGEPLPDGWRVGVSLVPTLVFTLVTAEILRDLFAVDAWLFGGLVIDTIGNTLVPGFVLRLLEAELDDPELPAVTAAYASTLSSFEEYEAGLGGRESRAGR